MEYTEFIGFYDLFQSARWNITVVLSRVSPLTILFGDHSISWSFFEVIFCTEHVVLSHLDISQCLQGAQTVPSQCGNLSRVVELKLLLSEYLI